MAPEESEERPSTGDPGPSGVSEETPRIREAEAADPGEAGEGAGEDGAAERAQPAEEDVGGGEAAGGREGDNDAAGHEGEREGLDTEAEVLTEAEEAEPPQEAAGPETTVERGGNSGGMPGTRVAAGGGLMTFPDSLVKRIMKQDEEVNLISTEAVKLMSHCTGLFLEALAEQSWKEAQKLRKRKTVQEGDVVHAITGSLVFRQCVGTSLSAMREGLHAAATAPDGNRPVAPPAKRQRKEDAGAKSKFITAFFLKS